MIADTMTVRRLDLAVPAGRRTLGRERINALSALAYALEAKDAYTHGHSARVSVNAHAIARRLGLVPPDLSNVVLGGELHDIGKIGVPEELLHKAGPLSTEEQRTVMTHTVIGERILHPLLYDWPELLGVVRWHHERVDGRGGPDGLSGNRIPLAARIVAVADAYDAMTSARPYRNARSVEQALDELRAGCGTQFDAACVAAFLEEFGDQPRPVAPAMRRARHRDLRHMPNLRRSASVRLASPRGMVMKTTMSRVGGERELVVTPEGSGS